MDAKELNGLVVTPAWNGLKQQILHLAQFGGSIQVILGANGAGKTAFFSSLQAEEFGGRFVGVTVEPSSGPEAFFFSLIDSLGLRPAPGASLGQLIVSLRAFVQSQHQDRLRIVVAVDDVHLLSEAALAALISVLQGNTDSGVGLHLIFFSELGIVELIDSLNLLDVTVHDAQLPTFSPSEIKKLLLEYFPGSHHDEAMSAEQIQAIWVDSKGLPGEAIRLAQVLAEQSNEKLPLHFFKGLPVAHFAALFLLCAALFWVFVLRTEGEGGGTELSALDETAYNVELLETKALVEQQSEVRSVVKSIAVKQEAKEQASSKYVEESEPRGQPELSKREARESVEFNKVVERVSLRDTALEDTEDDKKSPQVVKSTVKRKAVEAPKTVLQMQEEKLLRFSASGYAIQIMALADSKKLEAYMSKQSNRSSLLMYETSRKGRVLYILLEGFYADKQSAQMAVANLPVNQKKAGPWPKSLQSVHGEIAKNRRK